MKRREFLRRVPFFAVSTLAACGGGGEGNGAGAATPPNPPPPSPPTPGSQNSTGIPTLSLSGSQSGAFPYMAAVFPLQGEVPRGTTLVSSDDPTLDASVLSTWPDGSAAVLVLAGEATVSAGTSKQIRLQGGSGSRIALPASRVGQLVTRIVVNCGALGSAVIADFSRPAKTWWSNANVICCRYRVPVGSDPTLEAVVDVHAFAADRALVEIVVENCKMNTTAPIAPPSKNYTATVSVNERIVATVTSANAPNGGHQAFRAWYVSSWVGGDPGVEVNRDTASMQAHPLLFRCDQPGGNMAVYASDTYAPWSVGRHRAAGMGSGGDFPDIGPIPVWEAQYVQTGDANARRATIASALAVLTYNINYRDRGTGLVPTFDQLAGKNQQGGGWPHINSEPGWEVAHHPAAGLMAFLCHPSPTFIEIAQKIAVWNGTWSSSDGTFGTYYQTRGKAWCLRSLVHATFLSPSGDPWKAAGLAALYRNALLLDQFRTSANAKLGFIWDFAPNTVLDFGRGTPGLQEPLWQHHYLLVELHKAANARLLSGAQQEKLTVLADWAASQPVRYINESVGGEWRVIPYETTVGRANYDVTNGSDQGSGVYAGAVMDSLPSWGQQFAWYFVDSPPPVAGPWMTGEGFTNTYASMQVDGLAGAFYPSYFWSALVAAVERGVPGADTAWTKVLDNVTNLSTWRRGFATDPRWGTFPRNK
jgi:hypothetical protein